MPRIVSSNPGQKAVALQQERRNQLRGLLILALLTLLLVLMRADRHAIFHTGWWRP